MSLSIRDSLIQQCWVPAHLKHPTSETGPHFPVQVWGVIDDPRYRMNGEKPFADVVAWWPALKKWTCTSQCVGDLDVDDVQCRVTFWQPMPPVPETWP